MKKCSLDEFELAIQTGKNCHTLDVREAGEYASEFVPGTEHKPLTLIEKGSDLGLNKDKQIYLFCMSGNRATRAAEKLEAQGFSQVYVVEGGLNAWKQAGKPVQKGKSSVWSLERQVRFAAGFLVAIGILGSFWIHPGFVGLALFVGCGLMFAAITDTCAMGMLIARLPWNQSGCQSASCSAKRK